jgi:hypothetical protein
MEPSVGAQSLGAPHRILKRLVELCNASQNLPKPCRVFQRLSEFSDALQNLLAVRRAFDRAWESYGKRVKPLRAAVKFHGAPKALGGAGRFDEGRKDSAGRCQLLRRSGKSCRCPESSVARCKFLYATGRLSGTLRIFANCSNILRGAATLRRATENPALRSVFYKGGLVLDVAGVD